MPRDKKGAKGFTLIEIIAVLVVLAIVSAVVYSRGSSTAEAEVNATVEALKGHIRFVQMRAMNSDPVSGCNSAFGMASDGTKYYMFKDCNAASKVILPGATDISGVKLPSGSTFTTFSFDKWGRPYSSSDGTGTSETISLTVKGKSIAITKNTGFVP